MKRTLCLLPIFAGLALTGCQSTQQTSQQPAQQPAPAEPARPAEQPRATGGVYRPNAGANMSVVQLAFPTGDVSSSALLIHQVTPVEVRAGAPYAYEIHATNLTSGTLQNVVVMQEAIDNLTVTGSQPSAAQGGDGLVWSLGDLGPKQTKVIKVNANALKVGNASNCLSASYANALCATVRVVEPALTLKKTATQVAMLCDEIVLTYEVCNTGTGVAEGVRVRDTLPAGLRTADGKTSIDQEVGSLTAGQCKTITVRAKADKPGRYESAANAASSGGLTAASGNTVTVVSQPVLTITAKCTERLYAGRNATFTFEVKNTGDAASNDTVVTAAMPAGATFVSAEGGAAQGQNVVWNLGSLAAGQSRTVSFTVKSTTSGNLATTARVKGVCTNEPTANCAVAVEGIPALQLEVIDTEDPIMVGEQTVYVIQIFNEGSAPATNARVVCELPAELEFVSAPGASASGNKVTFNPIASIGARQTVELRVTVRAKAAGNTRFKTSLVTDQFTAPTEETEPTFIYQ
jgi:uncharacterized repeat protein (TIGR01451 family)